MGCQLFFRGGAPGGGWGGKNFFHRPALGDEIEGVGAIGETFVGVEKFWAQACTLEAGPVALSRTARMCSLCAPILSAGAIPTTRTRESRSRSHTMANMTTQRASTEDERPTARSTPIPHKSSSGAKGPHRRPCEESLTRTAHRDANKHLALEMGLPSAQLPRDRYLVGAKVGGLGHQKVR